MATNVSVIEVSPGRVGLEVNSIRPLVEVSVGTSIGNTTITASNLGGGAGVFLSKVGGDLQFKSLTAGSSITLTPSGTEIQIDTVGLVNPATDFNAGTISSSQAVDSFAYSVAYGARWDLLVNGTSQKAGTIIATWTEDGANIDYADYFSPDINGSTSGISFDVQISGGNVILYATVTSGSWAVSGTRYYIPTNGAGTGPVSNVLAFGKILIGDATNTAAAQSVTGDVTISPTGVTTITPLIIDNADISATAAIAFSKMASLTADRVAITNGSGVLTTSSIVPGELGALSGIGGNIQTLLNQKLNLSGGTMTGALTTQNISVPSPYSISLAAGFTLSYAGLISTGSHSISMNSGTIGTNTGNLVTTSGGWNNGTSTVRFKKVAIGPWNMDTTASVNVAHGITGVGAVTPKILNVAVRIFPDAGITIHDLSRAGYAQTDLIVGANLTLTRDGAGFFDSALFSGTGFSRGDILIWYEP